MKLFNKPEHLTARQKIQQKIAEENKSAIPAAQVVSLEDDGWRHLSPAGLKSLTIADLLSDAHKLVVKINSRVGPVYISTSIETTVALKKKHPNAMIVPVHQLLEIFRKGGPDADKWMDPESIAVFGWMISATGAKLTAFEALTDKPQSNTMHL